MTDQTIAALLREAVAAPSEAIRRELAALAESFTSQLRDLFRGLR